MLGFVKNLFSSKKEPTDAELYDMWNKSEKIISDFDKYIMKIKNNKEVVISQEIVNIKLNSFIDVKNLIDVLDKTYNNKSNVNVNALTTSKYKRIVSYIYEQIKFIYELSLKQFTFNNSLMYFLFSPRTEIFTFLLNNYNKYEDKNNNNTSEKIGTKKELIEVIYSTFFKEEIYCALLEIYLLNKSKTETDFLLPQKDNLTYIETNKSIPISIPYNQVFIFNNKDDKIKEGEMYLNLFILFQDKPIFNLLKQIYPHNSFPELKTLLTLYDYSQSIPSNKFHFINFIYKNDSISSAFMNISNITNKQLFTQIITDIVIISKEYSDKINSIKYLPLYILRNLIILNANIDYIEYTLSQIFEMNLYSSKTVFNFTLKYLIENYTSDITQATNMLNIISYIENNNYITCGSILNEIDICIKYISTIQKYNHNDESLCSILNNFGSEIQQKKVITILNDFIYNSLNDCINRKKTLNFIDKQYVDFNTIIQFYNTSSKSNLTNGYFLISFFNSNPNYNKYILDIILNNNTLQLNKNDFQILIQKFINNSNESESYKSIEEFLTSSLLNNVDTNLITELNEILDFLKIKTIFLQHNVSSEDLKDYNYINYQDKFSEILEIFLIKTNQLAQIESIETFLKQNISQEILEVYHKSKYDYLYHLFVLFVKYNKEKLSTNILTLLYKDYTTTQNTEIKYILCTCINYIYDKIYKDNKNDFCKYCEVNNLKGFILKEMDDEYAFLFIEDEHNNNKENANKNQKAKILYTLDKNANDLLNIIVNTKYNKSLIEKDNQYKPFINLYENLNNNETPSFNKLIELYAQYNDDNIEKVSYKYSLHPKLLSTLDEKNLSQYVNDIKVNIKSKLKVYDFCLRNNIITINDIVEYENISFTKRNSKEHLTDNLIILFNLYKPLYHEQFYTFLKDKIDFIKHNKTDIIYNLIEFNLSNIKSLSYNNILFLDTFIQSNFNITSNPEYSTVLRLLSELFPTLNILPFINYTQPNYFENELYPLYKNIIDRYCNDFSILNNNSKYFLKLHRNILTKCKVIEIYKCINISNWSQFQKLNIYTSFNLTAKEQFEIIFLLKLINSYCEMCTILNNDKEKENGFKLIIDIIKKLNLLNEHIQIIIEDLITFPSTSFILESNHNILLLNTSYKELYQFYFNAKKNICDKLYQLYPDLMRLPLLYNSQKLFKVKCHIINKIPSNDMKDVYNKIRDIQDFNELIYEVTAYGNIKEEIFDIYSQ